MVFGRPLPISSFLTFNPHFFGRRDKPRNQSCPFPFPSLPQKISFGPFFFFPNGSNPRIIISFSSLHFRIWGKGVVIFHRLSSPRAPPWNLFLPHPSYCPSNLCVIPPNPKFLVFRRNKLIPCPLTSRPNGLPSNVYFSFFLPLFRFPFISSKAHPVSSDIGFNHWPPSGPSHFPTHFFPALRFFFSFTSFFSGCKGDRFFSSLSPFDSCLHYPAILSFPFLH